MFDNSESGSIGYIEEDELEAKSHTDLIHHHSLQPSHCPKFVQCSAPVCPLNGPMHKQGYYDGEPICFYVREYVKGNIQGLNAAEKIIFQILSSTDIEDVANEKNRYVKALNRASKSASKRYIDSETMNLRKSSD